MIYFIKCLTTFPRVKKHLIAEGLHFRVLLALPNVRVAARFREASQAGSCHKVCDLSGYHYDNFHLFVKDLVSIQ